MTTQQAIQKHFGEERTCFFSQSDAHQLIEGDTFLRYIEDSGKVQLWFGGDNGEVCIFLTSDGDALDKLISIIKN